MFLVPDGRVDGNAPIIELRLLPYFPLQEKNFAYAYEGRASFCSSPYFGFEGVSD